MGRSAKFWFFSTKVLPEVTFSIIVNNHYSEKNVPVVEMIKLYTNIEKLKKPLKAPLK